MKERTNFHCSVMAGCHFEGRVVSFFSALGNHHDRFFMQSGTPAGCMPRRHLSPALPGHVPSVSRPISPRQNHPSPPASVPLFPMRPAPEPDRGLPGARGPCRTGPSEGLPDGARKKFPAARRGQGFPRLWACHIRLFLLPDGVVGMPRIACNIPSPARVAKGAAVGVPAGQTPGMSAFSCSGTRDLLVWPRVPGPRSGPGRGPFRFSTNRIPARSDRSVFFEEADHIFFDWTNAALR
jgi:hypothetical protein